MSEHIHTTSGGIGFLGALGILFIALKLLDKITWSWLWVLAPLWIPAAIVVFIIAVLLLIWLISVLIK